MNDPFQPTAAISGAARYWDGVARSYIPPARLDIAPGLKLHRGAPVDVDPVTFEVIRYALINANFEHCQLIQRLSVSPIVMIARDTQASILTEDGDLFCLGPNIQYFANSQSLATKWVLENRSASPGIRPGDMYLSNDPYVGTAHHQDTALMMPLFVGDELFCWVANTLHYSDVGGTSPGSFCINARDAWSDPPSFPGMRLVEEGRIRRDMEDIFVRQSRLRVNVLMDLRAAVTANQVTGRRIEDLIRRYGADRVKAVMRRVGDASEAIFAERLDHVPDGRWSARGYVEAALPGDEGIYRYQINLTKRDGHLYVDNLGTDPQAGAINLTFAAFSGAFLTSAVQAIAPDLAGAFGGAYRRIVFQPIAGLLNCAEHPAAVSPSGAVTSEVAINLSVHAINRMLACGDEEARARIIGAPQPAFYSQVYAGLDGQGHPFVQPTSDNMIGTQGGTALADGAEASGAFWMPGAIAENVEQVEDAYPILYLHRRFLGGADTGAGRHRGGLGIEVTVMPWGAQHFEIALATNESFARANGVLGGNPGGLGRTRIITQTDIAARFAAGEIPGTIAELTGDEEPVAPKAHDIVLHEGSLVSWTGATTAGFGDPLLREPAACLRDVEQGLMPASEVERAYGVVIANTRASRTIDEAATQERRKALFVQRLGYQARPAADLPGGAVRAGDALYRDADHWLCGNCGHQHGPVTDNFKDSAVIRRSPVDRIGPGFASSLPAFAARMEFREFLCGACGVRFDTEIARTDDPVLHDLTIDRQ